MSNEVLVRAFEPADFPAVTDVMNQPRAIWGTLQSPYLSIEARQKRHAALPASDRLLVALIDGKVIGMAGLHTQDNRRRAHAASIGMAVHDAFVGRGAGRALLSALLELADKWLNYRRVELTVWSDNARAIALYESAGFEREGLMRAYAWRDGSYADALAMARLRL
jgi:putative acetyltransferase